MKDFKGKVICITGAGSGMGRAFSIAFATYGAKLALNDWNEVNLLETKKLSLAAGANEVFTKRFDVSKKEEVFSFAADVKQQLGNTHIIINNAGISGNGDPFYNGDEAIFDQVLDINLHGVIHGCRAFLPQIVENNEGAVVNVASIFGLIGVPNVTAYCAAKFAVRGFTESLMVEFHKSPIGIHCLMPGGINTAIADDAPNAEEFKKNLKTPPEDVAKYLIQCIKNGKPDVLYGHGSSIAKFSARFVPLKSRIKFLWDRMLKTTGGEEFKAFNSLMK